MSRRVTVAPAACCGSRCESKWQVVGFGLSLALIAMMDMFIWPAYRDQLQNFELPPAFRRFSAS
jgi:hypothetical protein